jgi:hypothetical protein
MVTIDAVVTRLDHQFITKLLYVKWRVRLQRAWHEPSAQSVEPSAQSRIVVHLKREDVPGPRTRFPGLKSAGIERPTGQDESDS